MVSTIARDARVDGARRGWYRVRPSEDGCDVEAKAPCGTGVESTQLGRRVGGGRNRQNQAAVARINELPSTVGRAYTQTCARLWMQTVCGREGGGDYVPELTL
jgi:hypothetical protein